MKGIARYAAQLVALCLALALLVLGAVAIALPRLVNTDEFREALHARAAEALGTPVEWSRLEAGVVPLRLTIEGPVLVAAPEARDEARLTADAVDLRLSALALLERRVEVESLVFSGVELVVTRTPEGLVLPIAPPEAAPADASEGPDAAPAPPPDGPAPAPDEETAPLELAMRRFVIEDSRLVVRDRAQGPPLDWSFDELNLVATGEVDGEPLVIEATTRVLAGDEEAGRLDVAGGVVLGGRYDLALTLDALRLDTLQRYVEEATVAGLASGQVRIEGTPDVVSRFETDLVVEALDVRTFGLDVEGRLELVSSQEADAPIDFDATLDLGPSGRARVDGRMLPTGALEAEIALANLDLEPFAALAGPERAVGGRATGDLVLAMDPDGEIERLRTDLDVTGARYADARLALGGELDLVLGLEGLDPADPVRFDVTMDFAEGGGRIEADGMATLAGAVDTRLAFRDVDLGPLAPWLPEGTQLTGRLTGDADLALSADREVERAKTTLRIADARVESDPIEAAGRFDVDVVLESADRIRIASELALDDGSRITLGGTSTPRGRLDLEADVERFDLAVVRSFLPDPDMRLAGRATGQARFVGDVSRPEFVGVDVGVEGARFASGDVDLEGPLIAVAKIKEPLSRPRGRVELDLSAARLRYADQFAKPAGVRAELATRFVPEASGETVFEGRLALRDVDEILLQGAVGERTRVALSTTSVELEGWSELLPALAPYDAEGRLSAEGVGVELVDGVPRSFGGRIALRGVGFRPPDVSEPVRLRGAIVGEGNRIRTKGLKALVGGATVAIEGAIEDPLGEGAFDLALATRDDAEANAVLSALTATRDTVFGPLRFEGRVSGRLGAEGDVTETLDGEVQFTVGEGTGGRLRGISLLRTVLDQLPLLGGAAALTRPFRGGRSVDDYFTERFDLIEGDFEIGGGQIEARTLRLAYPGYEARLKGPLRLRDLSIDMTGELLLKDDLVSAIGGLAGADIDREPIRIELARVTRTLDDPKVSMTRETLAVVPKLLFQGTGIDTITKGITKGIGKGVGRAIGGLLGGKE